MATTGIKDKFKSLEKKLYESFKNTFINDTPPSIVAKQSGGSPSVKYLKEFSERHSFASILPYESYDKETGLFFNRDTVGFVLYAMPATGLSSEELKVLNGIFSMQHKNNTSIQISLYGDPNIEPILENWLKFGSLNKEHKHKPMLDMLAHNRVNFMKHGKWQSLFSDEPALLKNCHLIISYTIPVDEKISPVDLSEGDMSFLLRIRESIIGNLRSAKIYSQPMAPETLINLMDGMLNPSSEKKEKLYYDEKNLISSQIIDSDTQVLWSAAVSSITHKNESYSIIPFHVKQFPRVWPGYKNGELIGSFTNSILRYSCPFLLTLTVNVTDQVKEKGDVKKKQIRATQMSSSSIAKYVPQWKERKEDWDFADKKVDQGNKMMESFYQVILFSPEGKEQEVEQSLKGIFDKQGWILTRSRYTPLHSLLGAIPMGVCQDTYKALKTFGHYRKTLSWTCTNLAPWIAEFKGTKTPLMLLSGKKGQIGFFDNFDNEKGNFNISCSGTSGGGKSFLTQEIIQRTIADDGRVFVIDAGHSYKNINRLLEGTYIDFGKDKPRYNPFSTIPNNDPIFISDQIPLLKRLFEQMASPEEPLNQVYKSTLEKAIMGAWNEKSNDADVDEVIRQLALDVDQNNRITKEAVYLRKALYSYSSEGIYGSYFKGKSNIDLDNKFIVLDLNSLNGTPDLQSVVLLILMMRITQIMYLSGNRSQRKVCIIDEAWRLLGSGGSGGFIEEGYRVARKHGGCFMTITQRIADYYSSATAQAAFMNSDISIYLRQKKEELVQAEMNGQIDNSSGVIDILKGLQTQRNKFSELAIKSPDGLSVHRLYVDPIAAKLYSTTAEDVDFILDMEEKGFSILESVHALVQKEHSEKAI